MALSRNFLIFAVSAIFLSSLTLLPSISGEFEGSSSRYDDELRKMVLGSRPPGCVNKCMSCRPCEATLVIPPHQNRIKWVEYEKSSHREADSYYLLSWKCRCGNKLYIP
ncbi:hypothetical protein ACS0TY_034262 [Phlomoides rotata]